MKKYFAIIWRNRRQRIVAFLFRRPINTFAKAVISRARELSIINSHQQHELAAIIDRSLYPEYYESSWVDENGKSTTPPSEEPARKPH